MTRANANKWFVSAKAANSIVPISRFVRPTIFATKTSGYGCLFSLAGVDEEGLTDQELDAKVRAIEGGLRGLPEGSCLYQYMRVTSGFDRADDGPRPGRISVRTPNLPQPITARRDSGCAHLS
jgi:type IV secretion system protein VirB4